MKNVRSLFVTVSASLALVGCGADSGTTAAEDAAFKSGAKPTVNIPAGANKPPANFKSSLDTGSGPHPSGGVPGANGG